MTYPNPSTALATVVIDELVRGGVSLVVASPGSRSTALVLAVTAQSKADSVIAIDERSAGFHALGFAKATGRPAAVITTSGTAAANLLPAVVEADMAGIPLIAVSADRPPELRGVGANQAIDQPGIYGTFVRASLDLGPAEVNPSAPRWWRSMVCQGLAAASGFGGRPGPVHLNIGFREPTVAVSDDGRTREEPYPWVDDGRPDGRPWTEAITRPFAPVRLTEPLTDIIARARRGVIIAGGGVDGTGSIAELGDHFGWPVLATAESGLRGRGDVVSTGHHLAERVEPDLVIRFGSPGPSRRLLEMVSRPTPQVVVDPNWSDHARVARLLVPAPPDQVALALMDQVPPRPADDWVKWWSQADSAVIEALTPELERTLTEPAAAAAVGASGADLVVVGSSMPIRDVEAFAFSVPRVIGNRGASGVDGFVSTALGAARSVARPLALTGDLSLLHDSNGFLVDRIPDCVLVVVDNGGGGIFSFLPQAEHVGEAFERLFTTPHGRNLADLARFHGLRHSRAQTVDELRRAIEAGWDDGGVSLVLVETEREENVAEHRRLDRLALQAVAGVGPPPD
ncbi:MAG TPA: 2-succinyl-5-enolpyruvyl-6-hydroxy-3-cyclohexene-1-carboxylic-acid synthase [Acidimicrobiia bacterium]|nr:2-succinyl-5-enolpyruvyl-6-hydroxy-3-cyclohexene-1-carboxylic-acid synthase [Acidimicrobiia bacterium]